MYKFVLNCGSYKAAVTAVGSILGWYCAAMHVFDFIYNSVC
jgi:hypothetical protein